jgi:hypothetical protein
MSSWTINGGNARKPFEGWHSEVEVTALTDGLYVEVTESAGFGEPELHTDECIPYDVIVALLESQGFTVTR